MPRFPLSQTAVAAAAVVVDEFESSPGCADVKAKPGQAAEDLRYGLWACWDMFTRYGVLSS